MEYPQTPRILATHLQQFQHKTVRMVGKVVELRGETAVIDAGGNVDVILNRVCSFSLFLGGKEGFFVTLRWDGGSGGYTNATTSRRERRNKVVANNTLALWGE
ncbi:unnamed protein product [Periconia digitata]|uniref:Uncharacterized protein n=1 Tax=Periconia digitata TaxID=1303443 RepID=A0A9W4UAF2_9PLEO|nr:unnamed protein product [Periconia digitata]